MKIVTDEARYELLMLDYQVSEIARLNEVLRRNGIADKTLRQAICGEFADANGSFLDQGWLYKDGTEPHFPELLFSKRPLDLGEGLGHMQELVVPEYASNFHDYVSGAIEYYFDENHESLGSIQTGGF
ncbi:MAG: hypothetical protein V4858_24410 [Pseudomonadota bacterium]